MRETAGTAASLLEHADERRELGIAYPACRIFDIEPGSPPLAVLRPALKVFAYLEEKDHDFDESIIVEFALDVPVGADRLAEK